MRKNGKRYLAGLLIVIMIVGIFPDFIGFPSVTSASDEVNIDYNNTETYLTFDDYRTAYEELPNIATSYTLGKTSQVQLMDKVTFRGDISFSAEGNANDCTFIIGGNYLPATVEERDKTASGIGLYISGGKMYAYNHFVKGGEPVELGTAPIGYYNRVIMQFTKVTERTWNVSYTVNGVVTDSITYEQDYDFGPYLSFCPNTDDASGSKNSITCKSVQADYTYLSFHDYQIQGDVLSSQDWTKIPQSVTDSIIAMTTQVNTLDKVVFQGNITFTSEGTAYENAFTIGGISKPIIGTGSDLQEGGLAFYISGNKLYIHNKSYPSSGNVAICDAAINTPIGMDLQFEQIGPAKWQVKYVIAIGSVESTGTWSWMNAYGTDYYDFGPYMRFHAGAGISVSSITGNNPVKLMQPKSYDLSDGDYLVSGKAVVKDMDGQTVLTTPCENPTISAGGDYIITTTEGSFSRDQTVSLYKTGDLNHDKVLCDSSDYSELVKLLHYVQEGDEESYVRAYAPDCAVEYAADLNNNGKVDKQDLDLLGAIVKKNSTLESVLEKYHAPTVSFDYLGGKDVMPIVGYYGPYYGPLGNKMDNGEYTNFNFLTDDIYLKIKELGVNFINDSINQLGNNSGTRYVYQQLQYAEKYGVGQLISDAALNPELATDSQGKYTEVADAMGPTIGELAEQMGSYAYYDSYLGTYVRDEPYFGYRGNVVSENNKQLKYFDWIAKKMNQFANNLGFINSVGGGSEFVYSSWSASNTRYNFKHGLEEISNQTSAKVLSHTSYPFSSGQSLDDVSHLSTCQHGAWNVYTDGVVCPEQEWQHYYKNLWDSREVSQKYGSTFWVYTAAGGDLREPGVKNATAATNQNSLPTEAETYWDVNQKLAFGAKGIEWFTLLQPWYFAQDSTKESGFDYDRNGLIGLNGEVTTFGHYATEINKQIAAIDDVLMRSTSTGIMATGSTTISRVTLDGDTLLSETDALKSVTGDATDGYGALVGCFAYGDTEAFYVMNYNLNTSQTFTLNFDKEHSYRYVSEAIDYTDSGSSLTLKDIKPGRAVLVVLDEQDVRYADDADKVLKVESGDMSASEKNITFLTDNIESVYGSSVQETVSFAYDTEAVFLNGKAIRPTIKEVNAYGVWGYQIDLSDVTLEEGDLICLRGTIYPTSGNDRGRLTEVYSKYYMWKNGVWSELPQGYYDVADYKSDIQNPSYPTVEGKLFAGWFTDESCETSYKENAGVAYARFVSAEILANLAQIPMDVKYDTPETMMRFVSTVDSDKYREVGFTIEVEGSTKGPKDVTTKDVYKEIVTMEGGVPFTKTPTDIHTESEWFFTFTLTGITNELFGRNIYVTPFWVTLDGTKVCGERMAKTVHMGIQANSGSDYGDIENGSGDSENGTGGFIEGEDNEDGYGPIS